MINTIISNIAGAFSKDFLFASFLPAILLMVAIGTAISAAAGWVAVLTIIEQLSSGQTALASTGLALIGILTAYLLSALRGPFINFWSGDSRTLLLVSHAFVRLGESWQRRRFVRLRQQADRSSSWLKILRAFEDEARLHWNAVNRQDASVQTEEHLRTQAESLSYLQETAAAPVVQRLAAQFKVYRNIEWLYAGVKRQLLDREEIDRFRSQKDAARLDREFGGIGTIRATRLGNIIESYNHYAHKRYRLEAEVLWPRLRSVVPEEYFALVQEPKVLLDFAATMASISLAFAFGIAIAGPWLWLSPLLSIVLVLWAIGSTIFFYGLSVSAAAQYGDMIRSCFDLYRLDLMQQLQLVRPKKLDAERAQWEKVSQLIVYGTELDLPLAPKSTDGQS